MLKSIALIFLVMCSTLAAQSQDFKFGLNLFPISAYKTVFDQDYLIMPDYTSLKLKQTISYSAHKSYGSGIFFRYNKNRFVAKSELNFFNRFYNLGRNITPPYQSTKRGSRLALRYFTIEVPLYAGYTLNYNGLIKITPFAGISAEFGKMKPVFPPVMKLFEENDAEILYSDFFRINERHPAITYNYTAGIEFMYYGTLIQIAAKKNGNPILLSMDPNNANLTDIYMLEGTLAFVLNRGGMFHTLLRGR